MAESRLPALGRRGGGWVALQALLILLFAVCAVVGPRWPAAARSWLSVIGSAIAVTGAVLAGDAALRLGKHLTPFPKPAAGSRLHTHGVYALVRHPIYGGVAILLFGAAITSSPLALIPVVLLFALFDAKRRVEERWLVEHDATYAEYRGQVTHAMIPGVW